jgi:hypothetical protein
MISLGVVDVTAQVVASEGSQGAHVINKKLGVSNVVFLGQAVEESCRGISTNIVRGMSKSYIEISAALRMIIGGFNTHTLVLT